MSRYSLSVYSVLFIQSFIFSQSGGGVVGKVGDYILDVIYYDLSAGHPDFTGASPNAYNDPTLHPSPYGPWLSVNKQHATSSFPDWFKRKEGLNQKFENEVLLKSETSDVGTTLHRLVNVSFQDSGR